MTIDVVQDYDKPATFKFNGTDPCTEFDTCLHEYRDRDSIIFSGMLEEVPKEYKVTLNNESQFTFIFGKASPTAAPATTSTLPAQPEPEPQPETEKTGAQPEIPTEKPAPTENPVTEQPETKPGSSTEKPDQPGPVPPESTQPSGESNSNEGNDSDQETVPTTSIGRLNTASNAVLMLLFVPIFV